MSGFANNALLGDGVRVGMENKERSKAFDGNPGHHVLLLWYIITTNCILLVEGGGEGRLAQKNIFDVLFT